MRFACPSTRPSPSAPTSATTTFSWTSADVLLYHLALGAGANPTDPARAAVRAGGPADGAADVRRGGARTSEPSSRPRCRFTGIDIDLSKVLHGAQSITVDGPIPASGEAVARSRIADVLDKQKAAVIIQETTVTDPAGAPLWTTSSSIFARGEGGFGGHRGPSDRGRGARPRAGPGDRDADAAAAGAAVPAVRRPQPAARRPGVRRARPASSGRSCTACAPTAWCASPSWTPCSTVT